ncbi:hypothetical protein FC959_04705 [Clostridium botulinum]|nr:hypothetical protein [Clostridium botulinum]
MDITHIDRLLFPMGNGATIPIQGVVNGKEYIIKTFNNVEGNKTLVNELVCYLIAKQLKLPIPNAILGIIDTETEIHQNVSSLEDFSDKCYGISFCSELIKPVTTINSSKMITLSSNYNWLIPKLMLFDHLIYNKDRNKGNLLISISKNNKQLYIIDHSHTFNLEALWNSTGLQQKIQDNDFLDTQIMDDNWYHYSKFKDALTIDSITMKENIQYFKDNLSIKFFNTIVDKVPLMWENNKDELLALSNYLIYRMEHIDDFANIILSTCY